MPLSMTGYGNAEYSENGISVKVDIKSLNSRFFDIHLKLHRSLYEFEAKITSLVKDHLERGRITVSMDIKVEADKLDELVLDKQRLKQFVDISKEISNEAEGVSLPNIDFYLSNPEIVKKETNFNKEQIDICIEKSLILALQETHKLRQIEGAKLGEDLLNRIDKSANLINEIKNITNSNWKTQVEKYKIRIQNILEDIKIDEQRMMQEISVMAEKRDITEEITRFNAHSDLFKNFLNDSNNQIGKKMNFLLQEIGREVNTIGSKTDLTEVSHIVVDLKNEIEKIREQVQNIL